MQVGVTKEEVYTIVNQHSHWYGTMIIEVVVPISRLDERSTERERSYAINARADGSFFWLAQNSIIKASDIVSITPMSEGKYRNSYKGSSGKITFNLKHYWPQDFTYYAKKDYKKLIGDSLNIPGVTPNNLDSLLGTRNVPANDNGLRRMNENLSFLNTLATENQKTLNISQSQTINNNNANMELAAQVKDEEQVPKLTDADQLKIQQQRQLAELLNDHSRYTNKKK